AVRNYASYRGGDDAALLGRFVVPVARLAEFSNALESIDERDVRVSAVLGANVSADLQSVALFNARGSRAFVDSIEAKADRPGTIYELAASASDRVVVFVELPLGGELELLVSAVHAAGARAKIRTGGVTADAFPISRDVVRFIRACLDVGVPF